MLGGLIVVALSVGATVFLDVIWGGSEGDARFPKFVQAAPASAREAYAYAVDHPEVLKYIPCYCGCGCEDAGHASNLDCFIDQRFPNGRIVYDRMGSG